MSTIDHTAAFPLVVPAPGFQNIDFGMNLRDWFAGQALAGYLADNTWAPETKADGVNDCYRWADAMMAARSQDDEESEQASDADPVTGNTYGEATL